MRTERLIRPKGFFPFSGKALLMSILTCFRREINKYEYFWVEKLPYLEV